MFKKILLPTDGSDSAEKEIGLVKKLIADDGEVIILSVAGKLTSSAFQSRKNVRKVNAGMLKEAKENVSKMEALFPEGINTRTIVKTGFPAETINKVAEDEDVELIVISSSGKSGIHRFIIGSVAEKVLKTSNIDVLLVQNNR
ncbi:universal stress protein [uncultured Methanobrevibacter sp.]|uniref:universal stress protein n=1 Tax=uncultured Methanobrevibacter sp. TaxID=253161 RepID=UPI0025D14BE5|nr:universal stress protein [uncultured Methanobrevibacter sp.]